MTSNDTPLSLPQHRLGWFELAQRPLSISKKLSLDWALGSYSTDDRIMDETADGDET
jgi:hypothetical protein